VKRRRKETTEMAEEGIISLSELEKAIRADFEEIKARDEKKEKIECVIFFICFFIGGLFMVLRVLVDLAPWIVAFPSGKVLVFRYFNLGGL